MAPIHFKIMHNSANTVAYTHIYIYKVPLLYKRISFKNCDSSSAKVYLSACQVGLSRSIDIDALRVVGLQ